MSYLEMYLEELPDLLQQGDVFLRFYAKEFPTLKPKESAFLILTYTCDLANPKDLNHICYCPIFNLDMIIETAVELYENRDNVVNDVKSRIFQIANNKFKFLFFLSPDQVFDNKPAVADLGQIYNIPKDFMEEIKKNRKISLNNPWKEKLGYMVGHLFNRIAIEDTVKSVLDQYVDDTKIIEEFLKEK